MATVSNNRRVHSTSTNLTNGVYNRAWALVESANKQLEARFALVEEMTEKAAHEETAQLKDLPIEMTDRTRCYVLPCGSWVNKKYLDDAINGQTSFVYRLDKHARPLYMTLSPPLFPGETTKATIALAHAPLKEI